MMNLERWNHRLPKRLLGINKGKEIQKDSEPPAQWKISSNTEEWLQRCLSRSLVRSIIISISSLKAQPYKHMIQKTSVSYANPVSSSLAFLLHLNYNFYVPPDMKSGPATAQDQRLYRSSRDPLDLKAKWTNRDNRHLRGNGDTRWRSSCSTSMLSTLALCKKDPESQYNPKEKSSEMNCFITQVI